MTRFAVPIFCAAGLLGLLALGSAPCSPTCGPGSAVASTTENAYTPSFKPDPKEEVNSFLVNVNTSAPDGASQDAPDTGTWGYDDPTFSDSSAGECNESGCTLNGRVPSPSTSSPCVSPVSSLLSVTPILLSLVRTDDGEGGGDGDTENNAGRWHEIDPHWADYGDIWPRNDWKNLHCDAPVWADEAPGWHHDRSPDDTGDNDDSTDDTGYDPEPEPDTGSDNDWRKHEVTPWCADTSFQLARWRSEDTGGTCEPAPRRGPQPGWEPDPDPGWEPDTGCDPDPGWEPDPEPDPGCDPEPCYPRHYRDWDVSDA